MWHCLRNQAVQADWQLSADDTIRSLRESPCPAEAISGTPSAAAEAPAAVTPLVAAASVRAPDAHIVMKGRNALKDLMKKRSKLAAGTDVLSVKHWQVRGMQIHCFAEEFLADYMSILEAAKSPEATVERNARDTAGEYSVFVNKMLLIPRKQRVLQNCGVLGSFAPGLASLDTSVELRRFWKIACHMGAEVAWASEYKRRMMPDKAAHLCHPSPEERAKAEKEILDLWRAVRTAEQLVFEGPDDLAHPFLQHLLELLGEIQFNRLQLVRELMLEVEKGNGFTDELVQEIRKWNSLVGNTLHVLEKVFGVLTPLKRGSSNGRVSNTRLAMVWKHIKVNAGALLVSRKCF